MLSRDRTGPPDPPTCARETGHDSDRFPLAALILSAALTKNQWKKACPSGGNWPEPGSPAAVTKGAGLIYVN
jgi:hypothetical protein